MRSTRYASGSISGSTRHHLTPTGIVAAIVCRWRSYRRIRDIESVPYTVMKDIGFRAAETANAK